MDAFTIASPLPIDEPVEILINQDDGDGTHSSCVIA